MRRRVICAALLLVTAACDGAQHSTAPRPPMAAAVTPTSPGTYLDGWQVFAPGLMCGTCTVYFRFILTMQDEAGKIVNQRVLPFGTFPGAQLTQPVLMFVDQPHDNTDESIAFEMDLTDQTGNLIAVCGSGVATAQTNGFSFFIPTSDACRSIGTGNNASRAASLIIGWPHANWPVDHLTFAVVPVQQTQSINVPVSIFGPPNSPHTAPGGELLINMPVTAVVSPASLASVTCATATSSCTVTGSTIGTGSLTLTAGGKSLTQPLAVVPLDVHQVTVSPATLTMTPGYVIGLTPTAINSHGSTISGPLPYVWTSSNTTVAQVSSSGVVTAVAAGRASITVSLISLSATVPATTEPLGGTLTGPTQVSTAGTYTYTGSATGCNTTCTFQWTQVSNLGTVVWTTPTATTNIFLNASNGLTKLQGAPVSGGVVGIAPFLTIINNIGSCGTKIIC